jgi:hypothetical protein
MRDLKRLLLEGDPVAREPGMSGDHIEAMRRAILVEARRQPESAPASWRLQPLALAAALAVCLVTGVTIGVRLGGGGSPSVMSVTSAPTRAVAPAARPAGSDVRRQLQITSPGGTRIIWTFHENLEL